jgi:hypothetical protein
MDDGFLFKVTGSSPASFFRVTVSPVSLKPAIGTGSQSKRLFKGKDADWFFHSSGGSCKKWESDAQIAIQRPLFPPG